MDNYRDETFRSTTRWKTIHEQCPKNSNEFRAIMSAIPPCVINTGAGTFFFQWKQVNQFRLDTDVIAHNNVGLELALWQMVDIIHIINEKLPLTCHEPGVSYLIYYRTILQHLTSINTFVKANLNVNLLCPNLALSWTLLEKHGDYKVPWILVPCCNKAIEFWVYSKYVRWKAEKELKRKDVLDVTIKTNVQIKYLGAAYLLLETGLEHANNSGHRPLIDAYTHEKNLVLVKAYVWVAFAYKDTEENFFLLQEALRLASDECGKITEDFMKKVQNKFDIANKHCLTVTNSCGYKRGISPETLLNTFMVEQDSVELTTASSLNKIKAELDIYLDDQSA
jgi:hypothetical protein